jgi:hypothetical protein
MANPRDLPPLLLGPLDTSPAGAASSGARPAAGDRPMAAPRSKPARPDPRPMRLAIAAGGMATLSALLATIATSAAPATASVATAQVNPASDAGIVRHVTLVVTLPPGATAPAAGSGSPVLVTQLPAPVAQPKTVIVTTTQSGRVVKP